MQIKTTDNNCGYQINDSVKSELFPLANRKLSDLCSENQELFVFPQSFGVYNDGIDEQTIFELNDKELVTHNVMGFVGRNDAQLTITSRFTRDANNDYFLHHMLQKVMAVNVFQFDQNQGEESIWDFLLYMFPYYLKKAFAQGVFKAYRSQRHNDLNIRGVIDVNRFVKDLPFRGSVPYSTREYSSDNYLLQLVRHTIEYIGKKSIGKKILSNDSDTIALVREITLITQHTFAPGNRQKIILKNMKPVSHPYYTEYKPLQNLCLRILRNAKLSFGNKRDKVYGILFDGAWLWEEYLNVLLKEDFVHPENKTGKHKHYLFDGNIQAIYPDYISKNKDSIVVADAKYMNLNNDSYSENSEKALSLYYKTITYMYRWQSRCGALFYPNPKEMVQSTLKIANTDGCLYKIGLAVPQDANNYKDWQKVMAQNEVQFIESVKQLLSNTKLT